MPDPDHRSAPDVREPIGARRAFVGAALSALVALRLRDGRASAAEMTKRPQLNQAELRSLVAWYDTLVPGAGRARVADFVQEQLRADPPFALLQLRYLNWPPPFAAFYRSGITALNAASRRRAGVPFEELSGRDARALASAAISEKVAGWPEVPPLRAWVTATRADAMDVVYGTPRAHAANDMPMLQVPPPRW
jgi:hypothetical protein